MPTVIDERPTRSAESEAREKFVRPQRIAAGENFYAMTGVLGSIAKADWDVVSKDQALRDAVVIANGDPLKISALLVDSEATRISKTYGSLFGSLHMWSASTGEYYGGSGDIADVLHAGAPIMTYYGEAVRKIPSVR